jgi:hypothetical protein
MSDLPTIDEAFDEAVELTSKDSFAEPKTEEKAPTKELETKPEKEVEEEGEDKAETEEEAFAEKPDLSGKTPEELEEVYKSWQKSYTQKRQEEKKALKEMETRLKELEAQVPKYEEDPALMTPQELQEWTLAQARKQVEDERDNAYIESQEKSFYELDPRLDENNPEYDEALLFTVAGKLSGEREAYEEKNKSIYGFDFVGRAKRLIKAYDESIKLKVQNYLKQNNETARGKVSQSSKVNPKSNSGKLKKSGGLDLDEAFEEALAETKGSFGW